LDVGRRGEEVAAKYLRRQGLRILKRNVRSGRGEIDLIATEGSTLVFVEVKARVTSQREGLTGLENVNARKRAALLKACTLYRSRYARDVETYRLDVVTVMFQAPEGEADVRWHRNVVDLDAGYRR
jgi:putative endonuclease